MMRRYLLFILGAVFAIAGFSGSVVATDNQNKSVGTVAGETAHDLQTKAQETAKTAAAETEKASKQISEVADDAFKKLSVQFQEAMKNFQASSQELTKHLQDEWEKFKQAYNKPAKP